MTDYSTFLHNRNRIKVMYIVSFFLAWKNLSYICCQQWLVDMISTHDCLDFMLISHHASCWHCFWCKAAIGMAYVLPIQWPTQWHMAFMTNFFVKFCLISQQYSQKFGSAKFLFYKHSKKLKKISGTVGMTDWWKKYGDKDRDETCSRTTSCLTVHKLHPQKYPYIICGVFIISKSAWNPTTTTLTIYIVYLKTPHVGIFMWVWLVDS